MHLPRHQRMAKVMRSRIGWIHCAAEALYHRHNTSALLRTCDALGIHNVHVASPTWFKPSVGPSKGAGHWLSLHRHGTPLEMAQALQAQGMAIAVADFADPPTPPEALPLDRPLCLWFGAELVGVDPEVRQIADHVVTLPMHGFAQSLNVSVAAAMILRAVTERARAGAVDRLGLPAEEQHETLTRWLLRDMKGWTPEEGAQAARELLAAR